MSSRHYRIITAILVTVDSRKRSAADVGFDWRRASEAVGASLSGVCGPLSAGL